MDKQFNELGPLVNYKEKCCEYGPRGCIHDTLLHNLEMGFVSLSVALHKAWKPY